MQEQTATAFRHLAEMVVGSADRTVVYERWFDHGTTPMPIEHWTTTAGWVSSIDRETAVGIYVYHPPLAALISSGKSWMRTIATSQGFEEHIFPRHYPPESLRAFGWYDDSDLQKELMAIRPLRPDESGERGNALTLADPVQCLGFYSMLIEVQRRTGGLLPTQLFEGGAFRVYEDQGGWTLRNEAKPRLEQGWGTCFEFSGAEFVFAGYADDVYEVRWSLLCSIADLLADLQITHRIVTANSCSYPRSERAKGQQAVELYRVPTLDIEVYIPQYKGVGDPWLELGGGDIAGDSLTTAFGLRLASGDILFSGCQGIGWQRLALAILSQFGTDSERWPEALRSRCGQPFPRSRIADLFPVI